MIAAAPSVAYIHEPFGLNHDRGFCGARFDHWFQYICPENEARYLPHMEKTIALRYNLEWDWDRLRSREGRRQVMRDYRRFAQQRAARDRPLLKDPIALFSAEWLAERFDMDVVVTIRHPAAFAHSLKRAGWHHDFSHFLDQPLLMRDHLLPFEEEIREFDKQPRDIIQHAVLLWKITHHMIGGYRRKYPDWTFVRHEDISLKPVSGFMDLFERLNLEFSAAAQIHIEEHSSARNATDAESPLQSIKRDSGTNIDRWKLALTGAEIDSIRRQVEKVSAEFYTDAEW